MRLFSAALAECLRDERDPNRIAHGTPDLLRQRILLIANGYEDCNDTTRLIDDPIPRLLPERNPIDDRRSRHRLPADTLAFARTVSRTARSCAWATRSPTR